MSLHVGDVIKVWDRTTYPAKFKRQICICPKRQQFLRLNSKPLFPPHLFISAAGANFLDHDSYLELQQLVRPYAKEIEEAEIVGRLTRTHVQSLAIAVEHCGALTRELKDFILEQLRKF